jgi:hypothetical protein
VQDELAALENTSKALDNRMATLRQETLAVKVDPEDFLELSSYPVKPKTG